MAGPGERSRTERKPRPLGPSAELPEPSPEPDVPPEPRTREDRAVVRDALGVGVAVGLSGFAFGVTSAGAGLSLPQTCALSLFVFTGASQFALVGALAAGGNPLTAAAGAFFLGVRNVFYGLRLSQLLRLPRAVRPLAAQLVIDETSLVAFAQPDRRSARIGFTVTGLALYALWNLSTLAGAAGASALGDTDAWGLDAAGPAVFLALLAPLLTGAVERATAALAVLLVLGCTPLLPAGVPVLAAGLAAPIVFVLKGRAFRAARAPERDDSKRGGPETGGPEPGGDARDSVRDAYKDAPDARRDADNDTPRDIRSARTADSDARRDARTSTEVSRDVPEEGGSQ